MKGGRAVNNTRKSIIFIAVLIVAIIVLVPLGKKSGSTDGDDSVINAVAATSTPTPTATVSPTPTPTPTPKPSYLVASYYGGSIPLGKDIDKSKLEVTLYYDDGTTEKVDSYDISGRTITEVGDNKFIIIYKGLVADFTVTGKKVIGVSATPARFTYMVGNGPDERDLTVMLYYSDGSTEETSEYVVSPAVLNKTGNQELTVISHGQTTKITLWGEAVKAMKSLSVSWDASFKPITDEIIQKKDLSVVAVYSDMTTERVTSYSLVTERFSEAGENELKVTYRGLTATTKIQVEAKLATDIRAEYKGDAIYVGEAPNRDDIEVYVTFNDGRELKVSDYTLKPELIEIPGDNRIRVTYDKLGTDIYITGVAEPEPDFEYASEVELSSNFGDFTVSVAVPKRLGTDILEAKTLKKSKVKKLMRKLKVTGDYIPFTIGFASDDDEAELPLPLRVTVPEEFDIGCTYLYYSQNVRTQAVRLNVEINKEERYIEPAYFGKIGTYILVCDPLLDATDDERDEYEKKKAKESK